MSLRMTLTAGFLVFSLVGCGHNFQAELRAQGVRSGCRYDAAHEISLAASATDSLRIRAGSGDLKVEGRQGLDEVRLTAQVCSSDQRYLDELQVTLDREGSDIILTTHYPDWSGFRFGNHVARIDLLVEMPLSMGVEIDDSSGSMEVSGTSALRIYDSSGSIDVSGILGPATIDDSSGSLKVEDVAGDVAIEDGSGSIEVRDIQGSLRVRDNSGSIDVVREGQDVMVERDGSDSINVRDVLGDFTVAVTAVVRFGIATSKDEWRSRSVSASAVALGRTV